MKKILLSLVFGYLFVNNMFSQGSQCTICDWDWTNTNNTPSNSNWTFVQGGGLNVENSTGSPWTGSVPEINNIILVQDYTTKNGWVLLYKDFGCYNGTNYPYFILYNKYTGKMRLFMYRYVAAHTENPTYGGLVKLKWNDPSKYTSLLSFCNVNYFPNSKYHNGSASCSDVGIFVLNGQQQQWYPNNFFVADFNMAFDPLTPNLTGYQLNFDVETLSSFDIKLNGTLDWKTRSLSANETLDDIKEGTTDGKTSWDYIYNGMKTIPKVTSSLPSSSDLDKVFSDQNTQLASFQSNSSITIDNLKMVSDFKQTMTLLSGNNNDFVNFLKSTSKTLPVAGKYVSAALQVYDFFAGKATSTPSQVNVMPTVTHGTVSLTGTMTATTSVSPIVFDLPGSGHDEIQPTKTPLWDCPLGVISLLRSPACAFRPVTILAGVYKQAVSGAESPYYKTYNSICITDNLSQLIGLNPTSNVSVASIKAALVGRVPANKNGKDYFREITEFGGFSTGGIPYKIIYTEPLKTFADRGDYILNNINEDGVFEISTPFIDITKFQNTSILLPQEMEFYIKIYAVLQANDPEATSTPIVLSMKYSVPSQPKPQGNYIPFPLTADQFINNNYKTRVFRNQTISNAGGSYHAATTEGNVIIDLSSEDVIFTVQQKFLFNPGFSAKATGSAKFVAKQYAKDFNVIPTITTSMSSVVKSDYLFGPNQDNQCKCLYSTSKSAKLEGENSIENLINESVRAGKDQYGPVVYPTITTGNITIDNLTAKTKGEVVVLNAIGNVVIQKHIDKTTSSVDLTGNANGIYFIKVIQEGRVNTFKIIKK